MDDLLKRSVALLARAAGQAVETRATVVRLLARPPYDPGGATYLTWLRPLPWCDTKSYKDMLRIVQWVVQWLGFVPLVLILLGDGQTVLRLRDLKRKHPATYKHVLVCNDGFHSMAHFMMAVLRLWWECFLSRSAPLPCVAGVCPPVRSDPRPSRPSAVADSLSCSARSESGPTSRTWSTTHGSTACSSSCPSWSRSSSF